MFGEESERKDTLTLASASKAQGEGKIELESGPINRYGHVVLEIAQTKKTVAEVEWKVAASKIPAKYRESVLRGIESVTEPEGPFPHLECGRLKVVVTGGSYHKQHSGDMSFEIAGARAFEDAINKALDKNEGKRIERKPDEESESAS